MSMLEYVKITNFQSHQSTVYRLGPRMNSIVGVTQHGKSVFVKAVRWVSKNRAPAGTTRAGNPKFIYKRADPLIAEVEVKTTDGNVVSITKGKNKKLTYTVNGSSYEPGTSVPDAVQEALNFGSLNIQYQLELPFLMTIPPGQVAKIINDVTRLGDADIWRSRITSKKNIIDSSIVSKEQVLSANLDRINRFKDAGSDDLKVTVAKLKEVDQTLIKGNAQINELLDLIDRHDSAEESCTKLSEALVLLKDIEKSLIEIEVKEDEQIEIYNHLTLVDDIEVLNNVKRLSYVYKSITDGDERKSALIQEYTGILAHRTLLSDIDGLIDDFNKNLIGYEHGLRLEKICPFCGGEITEDAITKAVEALR